MLPLLFLLPVVACKTWRPAFLSQQTPRERYAESLRDAPAGQTPAGKRWAADADSALRHPARISLPYREQGRIAPGANAAAALEFGAAGGERICIRTGGTALPAFLELWGPGPEAPRRLLFPDSGNTLIHDAESAGTYVLLLQHSLESRADYTLTISLLPSLAYPATNPKKNRIGSVWGDARDAGARRHEGVDIFAQKGSPALAAAPGRIIRLTDGGLGGKTVWLRPEDKSYSLYYAHLDSQWVREGQTVHTGDTLGQIGNTGNARHTAAHLHFGIYGYRGAIDPAPFIRPRDTTTAAAKAPSNLMGGIQETAARVQLHSGPGSGTEALTSLPSGARVRVVAATRDWLRLRVSDTLVGWVPYTKSAFR